MIWLLHIFTMASYLVFVLFVLDKTIKDSIRNYFSNKTTYHPLYYFGLVIPTAWLASNALRASVTNILFYFDVTLIPTMKVAAAICLIMLIPTFPWVKTNYLSFKKTHKIPQPPYHWTELVAWGIMAIWISMFAYKALLPWFSYDEVAVYGQMTKYLVQGFKPSFLFEVGRGLIIGKPILIESMDAANLLLTGDVFLIRALRLVSLLMIHWACFCFLRLYGLSRAWSLWFIALLMATYEFQVDGSSLKPDVMVATFEITAMLFAALYFTTKDSQKSPNLAFLITSFFFTAFSLASRQSSMYLFAIVASLLIFETFKLKLNRNSRIIVGASFLFACVLASPSYLSALIDIGNPLYPFPCPWPFNHGERLIDMVALRNDFNINGIPPGLLQIYLIFHLALGIELRAKAYFPWLPHSKNILGSMIWLNPGMLFVFLFPLFIKKAKEIAFLSSLFLVLYLIWSMGLHYSRVFFAGSSITVVIAGLILAINDTELSLFQKQAMKFIKYSVPIFTIAMIYFNVRLMRYYTRHNPKDSFTYEGRINIRRSIHEELGDKLPPNSEFRSLDTLLSKRPTTRIGILSFSGRLNHVFFGNGLLTDINPNSPLKGAIDSRAECVIVNPDASHEGKGLAELASEYNVQSFHFEKSNWEFRCKPGIL